MTEKPSNLFKVGELVTICPPFDAEALASGCKVEWPSWDPTMTTHIHTRAYVTDFKYHQLRRKYTYYLSDTPGGHPYHLGKESHRGMKASWLEKWLLPVLIEKSVDVCSCSGFELFQAPCRCGWLARQKGV